MGIPEVVVIATGSVARVVAGAAGMEGAASEAVPPLELGD